MPEEARRGPKKLRFILSNQRELRTRAEKWNGMFSSFKHGVPSTEESAGHKLTSRHALAASARSLAVGSSEIYALLLNNG